MRKILAMTSYSFATLNLIGFVDRLFALAAVSPNFHADPRTVRRAFLGLDSRDDGAPDGSSKDGYTVHGPIHPMIQGDALD
jgi:hypothetical protein